MPSRLLRTRTISSCLVVFCVSFHVPAWVNAAFVPPSDTTNRTTASWTRPIDSTTAAANKATYQEWDVFGSANSTNSPNTPGSNVDVNGTPVAPNVFAAPQNPNGIATVQETTGLAFLTSGGNLYTPTAATAFSMQVPNYGIAGMWTSYLLQFRTLGSEIAPASLTINGTPISSLPQYSYEFVASGSGMGASTEYQFEFTLPANNAVDTIAWSASSSSMSMDKVSVDSIAIAASAVPEPSTWALLGICGTVAAAWNIRGRRKRV